MPSDHSDSTTQAALGESERSIGPHFGVKLGSSGEPWYVASDDVSLGFQWWLGNGLLVHVLFARQHRPHGEGTE